MNTKQNRRVFRKVRVLFLKIRILQHYKEDDPTTCWWINEFVCAADAMLAFPVASFGGTQKKCSPSSDLSHSRSSPARKRSLLFCLFPVLAVVFSFLCTVCSTVFRFLCGLVFLYLMAVLCFTFYLLSCMFLQIIIDNSFEIPDKALTSVFFLTIDYFIMVVASQWIIISFEIPSFYHNHQTT